MIILTIIQLILLLIIIIIAIIILADHRRRLREAHGADARREGRRPRQLHEGEVERVGLLVVRGVRDHSQHLGVQLVSVGGAVLVEVPGDHLEWVAAHAVSRREDPPAVDEGTAAEVKPVG